MLASSLRPGLGEFSSPQGASLRSSTWSTAGFRSRPPGMCSVSFMMSVSLPRRVHLHSRPITWPGCVTSGRKASCHPCFPRSNRRVLVSTRSSMPPEGKRGCAFGIAHDDYNALAPADALRAGNARTSFTPLIETAEGIKNADAIAAINGVDCLWIGHSDLSVSLGIAGDYPRAPVQECGWQTVMAAARRALEERRPPDRVAGGGGARLRRRRRFHLLPR